jgi:transposase
MNLSKKIEENQLQDLCEDPKKAERMNQLCLLLQHDNARPHTSAATSAAVDSIGFEVVPHPPYSPDLVLSDFWLFGALKKHLRDNRFTLRLILHENNKFSLH